MATTFWQARFSRFRFSCLFNQSFLVFFVIFWFLDHFSVYLMVLISFWSKLTDFVRFWSNLEIQDGRPRRLPLKDDDVFSMSYDVTKSFVDVKENNLRRTFHSEGGKICPVPTIANSTLVGYIWRRILICLCVKASICRPQCYHVWDGAFWKTWSCKRLTSFIRVIECVPMTTKKL